jgi:uncharacterized protein
VGTVRSITQHEVGVEEARAFLVSHLGLARFRKERGAPAVRAMLGALRCVQLDPLDPIGTNADLVTLARVRTAKRSDVYTSLLPGHAFEHFAKERCLLPPDAFPYYRSRMVETPWWRSSERGKKIDPGVLAGVLEEVRARGPLGARDLEDRGRVVPLDWSGWKGTSSAAKMALEILWTRCEVVVTSRRGKEKVYDVPERALPDHHATEISLPFEEWAIEDRVVAAGLLGESMSPSWSMLRDARKTGAVEQLIEKGRIERVRVGDRSSTYLAPAGFLERTVVKPDDAMRILGPLDPVLWDRALVKQVFDFEYVWEVYKPASQRRWGWYVCPLLHRGRLVGRIDARIEGDHLVVDRLFREKGVRLDDDALDACLARHAEACGVSRVRRKRR